MLKNFLLVGLGGAVGSMLRYAVTLLFAALQQSANWATVVVNVIGSFLIGILLGTLSPGSLQLLLTVGLCGGFTTFSTYSSQSITLMQNGHVGAGLAYIIGTVALCLLFVWLGRICSTIRL